MTDEHACALLAILAVHAAVDVGPCTGVEKLFDWIFSGLRACMVL